MGISGQCTGIRPAVNSGTPPRLARSSRNLLQILVQIDVHNHGLELGIGLIALCLQVGGFFAYCGQLVLLRIQLRRVALKERMLFGTSAQRLHVFANARLIGRNLLALLFALADLLVKAADFCSSAP
jgi:hypothetical protein